MKENKKVPPLHNIQDQEIIQINIFKVNYCPFYAPVAAGLIRIIISYNAQTVSTLATINEALHLGYMLPDVNSTPNTLVCNDYASYTFSTYSEQKHYNAEMLSISHQFVK